MKTKLLFIALLFALFAKAQINPTLYNDLGNEYIFNTVLDKTTNDLYYCLSDSGIIKKVSLNAPDQTPVTVLSGLPYIVDLTITNNKLYFIEAGTGLNADGQFIPNTGKLSFIDLSITNPAKTVLYSNLNAPLRLASNATHLFVDENTISIIDPDNFEDQTISKLTLSPPYTKTQILSFTYYSAVSETYPLENFEVINNDLYGNSYFTSNEGNFCKINLTTLSRVNTHQFTQNAPYDFAIDQNTIYYSDGYSNGGNRKTPINALNNSPLTLNFLYNGAQVSFENWEFDNNNNAYVIGEIYNNNTETMLLYKYVNTQLPTVENSSNAEISVYPNPAIDFINIKIENSKKIRFVQILDTSGRIVKKYNTVSEKLDISDLEKGVYFLKIYTTDKQYSTKFIKI